MPKVLITGNGFDLRLGLPTSYNDFIQILNFIEINEIEFEALYSTSSNYDKILENFRPFDFDYNKIDDLKSDIATNIWFKFFKNEFEIDTWIDFENRIEYVLKIIFSSINNVREHLFSKSSLSDQKLNYTSKLFNSNVEVMQVLNKFNIIILGDDYAVRLNKEYLVKKYDFYVDIDLDKITKKLYQELIGFKKIFNYYFEIFVFPFYDNINKKINRTLFSTISYHYTFNYTPTFEKIYKKSINTNFLHGRIDSKLNQIVLGINEVPNEEIDKKYFLPFTKYFQKLNNDTDYVFISQFEKRKTTNYQFFFLGHSLNKSDEDYINEIFDFVNDLKSKVKKIIVIYHNKKSKSRMLINLLNIRGKRDIQELMRSEVLMFKLDDSVELKRELKREIPRTPSIQIGN